MQETQKLGCGLETVDRRKSVSFGAGRLRHASAPTADSRSSTASRPAFTLTELLIVIAIIAVLAALITAAARNALRAGNRGRIVLEIKNMGAAVENFRNEYGAYPPNVVSPPTGGNNPTRDRCAKDMIRMFKKARPRMNPQEELVIQALAGIRPVSSGGFSLTSDPVPGGMNGEEALYFWIAGFSSDPQFPLSGEGGPAFSWEDERLADEVMENRNKAFEFDVSRLFPRDDNGLFDPNEGRYITYQINVNGTIHNRRINLWRFAPQGSEVPYVYYDVSRYKPYQYDPPGESSSPGAMDVANVFALKQYREGVASSTPNLAMKDLAFVNNGKFQILHAGLDGDWGGNDGQFGQSASNSSTTLSNIPIYPAGPFVGAIADTLTNFTDGELADEQENE